MRVVYAAETRGDGMFEADEREFYLANAQIALREEALLEQIRRE